MGKEFQTLVHAVGELGRATSDNPEAQLALVLIARTIDTVLAPALGEPAPDAGGAIALRDIEAAAMLRRLET